MTHYWIQERVGDQWLDYGVRDFEALAVERVRQLLKESPGYYRLVRRETKTTDTEIDVTQKTS